MPAHEPNFAFYVGTRQSNIAPVTKYHMEYRSAIAKVPTKQNFGAGKLREGDKIAACVALSGAEVAGE